MRNGAIQPIDEFLQQYKIFKESNLSRRIKNSKLRFEEILNGVSDLRLRYEKEKSHYAHNFNLFEILGIRHLEVITHSPMLGNLLDVNGSHDQGDLFFKALINRVFKDHPEKTQMFLPDEFDCFNLRLEKSSFEGRIDLLITYGDFNKKFAVCIENKIYAADQDKQLQRYYDYLIRIGYKNEEILLIYLTIGKDAPTTDSTENNKKNCNNYTISQATLNDLNNVNNFHSIGYRDDIYPLLSGLINYIRSVKVKTTVKQYAQILNQI